MGKISLKTNKHNGVDYKKIESETPIEGVLAFGNLKLVLRGKPAIEIMENSYKYGDQVQVTVYNKSGSVRKRPRVVYASKYDRIELFFNRKDFEEMITLYNSQT